MEQSEVLTNRALEPKIMTDLTFDEFRGNSPEDLSRILREEALKIYGEHPSDTRLARAADGSCASAGSRSVGDKRCLFLKVLLVFLSLPRRFLPNHEPV